MPQSRTSEIEALLAHVGWVRGLAFQLVGDANDADDVTQETIAAALSHPPRPGLDARAWLGRVLGNVVRMQRRKDSRRIGREQRAGHARALAAENADLLEQWERQKRLAQLVDELPRPYRTVILARFYLGESTAQTARRLDLNPVSLRSQLARGLKLLRKRLIEIEGSEGRARDSLLAIVAGGSFVSTGTGALSIPSWILLMKLSTKLALAGAAALLLILSSFVWQMFEEDSTPSTQSAQAADRLPEEEDALLTLDRDSREGRTRAVMAHEGHREGTDDALDPSASFLCRVRVVDDRDGTPLRRARIFRLPADSGLQIHPVDEHGTTEITSLRRTDRLAAWAPGFLPQGLLTNHTAGGPIELRLSPGVSLAGRVVLESGVDTERALLHLVPNEPSSFSTWPTDLARAVRAQIPGWEEAPLRIDAMGRFAIAGLPSDWSGRLQVENGFQIVGCEPKLSFLPESLSLSAPITQLRIELQATPKVWGQVLWADTRTPVQEGPVAVSVLYVDGSKSYITNRELDEQGHFAAGVFPYATPYGRPAMETIRVEVHPEGGESKTVTIHDCPDSGEIDPILVQRVPDLHFIVQDREGFPIGNALVAGELPRDYGQYRKHTRSDAHGCGTLRNLPLTTTKITVGAEGYAVREFPVPRQRGSFEEPLEIVLEESNRLRIRLTTEGMSREGLRLVLRHEAPLLLAETPNQDPVRRRFLELLADGYRDSEQAYVYWFSAESREFQISGLHPHLNLVAEIRAPHGGLLAEQRFQGPGPTEDQLIVIPVSGERRTIHGRVLDSDGRPVAGARVRLEWNDVGVQWLATTTSEGAFAARTLQVVGREARRIYIDAPGFAWLQSELPAGTSSGDLGEFRLETGQLLEVVVRDTNGQELEPQSLRATLVGGLEVRGQYIDGRNRLAGLPAAPLTVHVKIGGRSYSRACRFPESPLTITVAAHGRLALRHSAAVPNYYPEDDAWLDLLAPGEPDFRIRLRSDQPWQRALLPGNYALVGEEHRVEFEVKAGMTTELDLGPGGPFE